MLTFLILVLVLIFLVLMFSLGLFMFIENKNRSIWIQQPQRNDPLYAEWYAFMQAEKEEWYLQTHDNLTLKAWYLPATKPTNKTILLANGYKSVRDRYGALVGSFMIWATTFSCRTIVQEQKVQENSLVLAG
ncbi:hypothetical protein [Lactococcus garvieae]|uniref:hypothetical protein n=1 Tax=Lactococcus garvieae TaxID=1363 RepID=UPI0022E6D361|nr:hypothetical protein [Lactococcus garvieae]